MAKPPPHRKPPTSLPARASHQKSETERVAGLPAVTALFENSPERVERLFYDERMKALVGAFCKLLAARHKVYRMVPPEELAKIAGSPLHGGILAVARPKPIPLFDVEEAKLWAKAGKPLVILDGIGNPHNLGAIARTMAFFGLDRLVLSDHPGQARPSEAAYRVAEGGLEWVQLYHAPRLPHQLKRLKPYFRVVGTALGQGQPLAHLTAPGPRPLAVVLGNEEDGLPEPTIAACEDIATIIGSGRIQSLNVSATAAILIHAIAGGSGIVSR